jgi:hypothetical protein
LASCQGDEQVDGGGEGLAQSERLLRQGHLTGFQLGKVQNAVDGDQQAVGRGLQGIDIGGLGRR